MGRIRASPRARSLQKKIIEKVLAAQVAKRSCELWIYEGRWVPHYHQRSVRIRSTDVEGLPDSCYKCCGVEGFGEPFTDGKYKIHTVEQLDPFSRYAFQSSTKAELHFGASILGWMKPKEWTLRQVLEELRGRFVYVAHVSACMKSRQRPQWRKWRWARWFSRSLLWDQEFYSSSPKDVFCHSSKDIYFQSHAWKRVSRFYSRDYKRRSKAMNGPLSSLTRTIPLRDLNHWFCEPRTKARWFDLPSTGEVVEMVEISEKVCIDCETLWWTNGLIDWFDSSDKTKTWRCSYRWCRRRTRELTWSYWWYVYE